MTDIQNILHHYLFFLPYCIPSENEYYPVVLLSCGYIAKCVAKEGEVQRLVKEHILCKQSFIASLLQL